MRRSRWKHILRESGLCIDRVRLLDVVVRRPWLRGLAFRFLRLRFSPAILGNAITCSVDLEEQGRLYSLAMSQLNVGDTYKTTGSARTNLADAELKRLAEGWKKPTVLEVGVSDGCSALGLLRSKAFAQVVLTDRESCFHERPILFGRIFRKADGRLLGIKLLCFYLNLGDGPKGCLAEYSQVETVNPVVRETFGLRSIRRFDMFKDRLDEPVELIKCANILNLEYFSREDILHAVANLGRSLTPGGHLVISQNNARYSGGETFFGLRREGERLVLDGGDREHDATRLFDGGFGLATGKEHKPMRLVFLIPSLEVGGAEQQLVLLVNGLAARGHAVAVALHHGEGSLENLLRPDVEIILLGKRGRWDFFGFSSRLVRSARAFRPDVVCSFLSTPNILTGMLRRWLRPAAVVWSVRASNMDPAHYDWATHLAYGLEIRLSSRADGIVSNSRAGAEHVVKQGFKGRTPEVIPNGIDTDRFRPDRASGVSVRMEWGVDSEQVLVGLVARLDPMKDHETFLRAAALAARMDDGVRFVCVGEGPLEKTLRALGESLGLGDRLIWAGKRGDMPKVYNALDVACLASAFGEGFPNVLGEAMACGVPCVTTDVGDARVVVGPCGTIVPPGDPQMLAETLVATADKVRGGDIPEQRSRVVEAFSLDAMVERYESFFAEIDR